MSIPIVPLSAFCNLAGAALAEDIRRLLSRPSLGGLVLFSDTVGEQLALLPVGEGENYARVQQLAGLEIEGLRPLCAIDLKGDDASDETRAHDLTQRESRVGARERELAAEAERLDKLTRTLKDREAQIEEREQRVLAKERNLGLSGVGVQKVSVSSHRGAQTAKA